MALIIAIPTTYGVSANYWKIGIINEDYVKKELKIGLLGYADKSISLQEGSTPLATAELSVPPKEYIENCDRAQAYVIAKRVAQFSNAGSDNAIEPVQHLPGVPEGDLAEVIKLVKPEGAEVVLDSAENTPLPANS